MHLERGKMKQHFPCFGMAEFKLHIRCTADPALLPQLMKSRVLCLHLRDEIVIPAVLNILSVIRAENGQKPTDELLPIHRQPLEFLAHEQ
ncbi:hypothetical protein D3C80_2003660 [compost metagenome]